jgi:hypothetical protein
MLPQPSKSFADLVPHVSARCSLGLTEATSAAYSHQGADGDGKCEKIGDEREAASGAKKESPERSAEKYPNMTSGFTASEHGRRLAWSHERAGEAPLGERRKDLEDLLDSA